MALNAKCRIWDGHLHFCDHNKFTFLDHNKFLITSTHNKFTFLDHNKFLITSTHNKFTCLNFKSPASGLITPQVFFVRQKSYFLFF